jgi:small subunit ribosomal protein S1
MSAEEAAGEPGLALTASEVLTSQSTPTGGDSGSSAAPAPDVEQASAAEDRPAQRILIGSQRESVAGAEAPKANPVTPGPAAGAPMTDRPDAKRKSYPPPNIRAQLSPEQQAELDAAMGGTSLDELMTASADAGSTHLAAETRVKARVAAIHDQDVFFDLGVANQGVAQLTQFDPAPEIGAEIELIVVRFNEEQGLYEVSKPTAAVDVGRWDEVHEGQIIEVTITGANKGGLECQVSGIRGFIPMGQISLFRIENAAEFVGQRLACVVTEANRRRKNLVLSHRAVMERERKELRDQVLAEIAAGQIREGIVRSLQEFGAFVDLGGVDGLIHVSQMSWERIGHPSEVLVVGQTVKVRVEKVNSETGKISLAYRDLGANPWESAPSKYPIGAKVKGTVSKLMQFGAFVKLEPGVEGLIHISELGHGRVQRVGDVLSEGQEVEAKVLSIDANAQRISLSLKALLPPPERPAEKRPERPEPKAPPEPTPEELKRQEKRREKEKLLKGGIGGPSGGEQFGLKW